MLKCKSQNRTFNSSKIGTFNTRQLKQALDCSAIIETIFSLKRGLHFGQSDRKWKQASKVVHLPFFLRHTTKVRFIYIEAGLSLIKFTDKKIPLISQKTGIFWQSKKLDYFLTSINVLFDCSQESLQWVWRVVPKYRVAICCNVLSGGVF